MARSVFPRLIGGEQARHRQILREALAEAHGRQILEIGAGGGSATAFLPADNDYVGIDVSPALLRRAAKAFARAGFSEATFYVASGEGVFTINGEEHLARQGDAFRMEASDRHDIRNDSHLPLKLLFIKYPYLPKDKVTT